MEPFPEGSEYWRLTRVAEEQCESLTLAAQVNSDGISTRLGTVMSLLYRMACCHWGCQGREHVFEYLAGRTCTSAQSAYRLIGFGYYDEALSLSRNVAEIGNLTHLFFTENEHIRTWLDLPSKDRRKEYSPVKVREKLRSLNAVIPTDQDAYSWLCEIGTHITPKTRPQAHNSDGRAILGAVYQSDGWSSAMNSLAWSVCTVAGPMAKLAILDRSQAERLFEETIALAESL